MTTICFLQYLQSSENRKDGPVIQCSTLRTEERCIQGFGWGNLRERGHLEDPGVDWILREWDVGKLTGSSWRRLGTGGGNL